MSDYHAENFSIEKDILTNSALVKVKGFLSSAEFRSINEQILTFITTHNLYKIVLEINALAVPYPSDRTWYIEDFIPRIIQAGLSIAAVLVPRNLLARLVVEDIIDKIRLDDMEIKTFTNLAKAKSWIETK